MRGVFISLQGCKLLKSSTSHLRFLPFIVLLIQNYDLTTFVEKKLNMFIITIKS